MQPREHHFGFAKRLITSNAFSSPDQMFTELTGHKREAFLMFLWQEAAKSVAEPLPHVAVEGTTLAKLEVVGAIRGPEKEVVVVSMPPAIAPNEAMWFAIVRSAAGVSVFFYERCLNPTMDGLHQSEAVLAEMRQDGMRINHGFKPGLTLDAFKSHLEGVLGMSLAGLETSLPPISMAGFMGQSAPVSLTKQSAPVSLSKNPMGAPPMGAPPMGAPPWGGPSVSSAAASPVPIGQALEMVALARAALPFATYVLSMLLGFLMAQIWVVFQWLPTLLTAAVWVVLLVWVHQIHTAKRNALRTTTPGMAVAWFLIPGANLVMPAYVMRDVWKATVGQQGVEIVYAWWALWVIEIALQVLASLELFYAPFPIGMLVAAGAFGLLWHVAKTINSRS